MLKELLSDFIKVINPYYQPDNFEPYLSVMLTIVTTTILLYTLQVTATNIYTYANRPSLFKDKLIKVSMCTGIEKTSLQEICEGIQDTSSTGYNSSDLVSSEQDLQSLIN